MGGGGSFPIPKLLFDSHKLVHSAIQIVRSSLLAFPAPSLLEFHILGRFPLLHTHPFLSVFLGVDLHPTFQIVTHKPSLFPGREMQLYHHPYSIESQKVRLALEERNIDYTSYHVNPVTGNNMDPFFFRMNPTAKLPVFQNGSHLLFNTIDIIQYIERIALVSSGSGIITQSSKQVVEWMNRIQEWNPKFFTLSHIPEKYYIYVSKFIRRVIIARMSKNPDLATAYHTKLKDVYLIEERLHNPQVIQTSEQHLVKLLDEVEAQLEESRYLAGDEFTLADVMLVPILARLALLGLENEYITSREKLAEYWTLVQQRPGYEKVIGKYFGGWKRRKTLLKTWCIVRMRCILKRY